MLAVSGAAIGVKVGGTMLILGVHPGYHDAAAVLCDDYRILAAVQLERLTRRAYGGSKPQPPELSPDQMCERFWTPPERKAL